MYDAVMEYGHCLFKIYRTTFRKSRIFCLITQLDQFVFPSISEQGKMGVDLRGSSVDYSTQFPDQPLNYVLYTFGQE